MNRKVSLLFLSVIALSAVADSYTVGTAGWFDNFFDLTPPKGPISLLPDDSIRVRSGLTDGIKDAADGIKDKLHKVFDKIKNLFHKATGTASLIQSRMGDFDEPEQNYRSVNYYPNCQFIVDDQTAAIASESGDEMHMIGTVVVSALPNISYNMMIFNFDTQKNLTYSSDNVRKGKWSIQPPTSIGYLDTASCEIDGSEAKNYDADVWYQYDEDTGAVGIIMKSWYDETSSMKRDYYAVSIVIRNAPAFLEKYIVQVVEFNESSGMVGLFRRMDETPPPQPYDVKPRSEA